MSIIKLITIIIVIKDEILKSRDVYNGFTANPKGRHLEKEYSVGI